MGKDRLDAAQELLALTQRLLELAGGDGDNTDTEAIEKVLEERAAVMGRIDSMANEPAGEAYGQVIREIVSLDERSRALLAQHVKDSQEDMRGARETKKGLSAYLSVQTQEQGMYIDRKN